MMYNEIYGNYYYMMKSILTEASNGAITAKSIRSIVMSQGFAESGLYFTPDAVSQDGSGYNLLVKDGDYKSLLKKAPISPMTEDQKRFIKTLLSDSRIRLFLDDEEIRRLESELKDVSVLYNIDDIVLAETAADGDNFGDIEYRKRFRMILDAVKQNKILKIVFDTSYGDRKTVIVAPYKMEYAVRDNKFRLCAVTVHKHRPSRYIKLNIARIAKIIVSQTKSQIDCEAFIAQKQLGQPIEIEVSDLRNGFERIFTQLSNYKRTSVYDPESHTCTMRINCTDDDVQELLIVLMSFGPAIKVLGPPNFKKKYVERIKKQMDMLKTGD